MSLRCIGENNTKHLDGFVMQYLSVTLFYAISSEPIKVVLLLVLLLLLQCTNDRPLDIESLGRHYIYAPFIFIVLMTAIVEVEVLNLVIGGKHSAQMSDGAFVKFGCVLTFYIL